MMGRWLRLCHMQLLHISMVLLDACGICTDQCKQSVQDRQQQIREFTNVMAVEYRADRKACIESFRAASTLLEADEHRFCLPWLSLAGVMVTDAVLLQIAEKNAAEDALEPAAEAAPTAEPTTTL